MHRPLKLALVLMLADCSVVSPATPTPHDPPGLATAAATGTVPPDPASPTVVGASTPTLGQAPTPTVVDTPTQASISLTPSEAVSPSPTAPPTPPSVPSPTRAAPTQPAPTPTPRDEKIVGHLGAGTGGRFVQYEFTYPGDRSVFTVNLNVTPGSTDVLKNAGFNVYGPDGQLVVSGGAQPNLVPNVSANVISSQAGRYVIQVHNYNPTVEIDYELSLVPHPPGA